MTDEEAGQRLLEGNPWLLCTICKGKGESFEPVGESSTRLQKRACSRCGGVGVTIDSSYHKAIRVLKAPWPELPNDAQRWAMNIKKEQERIAQDFEASLEPLRRMLKEWEKA